MASFADLAPCTYSRERFSELPLAVGWLDMENFPTGELRPATIRKLVAIHEDSPFRRDLHYRGMHPCPFCGVQGVIETDFGSLHVGARNILVPGTAALYYAPSMILHYIIDHGYRPPDVFLAAVEAVDLNSLDFVDDVSQTLILRTSPRDVYAERVGELFATQRGLISAFDLIGVRSDIVKEESPASAGSWPPQNLSEDAAARVASRFVRVRDDAYDDFVEAMEAHRGSKWFSVLSAYAERCRVIQPPTVSQFD